MQTNITIACDPAERRQLEKQADAAKLSLSELIRQKLKLRPKRMGRPRKQPATGE